MNKETCIRQVADLEQINRCISSLKQVKPSVSRLSEILKLAGSEVRLNILFLLQHEDQLCPCDLSDILSMSVPAISQHLRKLKDGNLVHTRREGQTIYYSLNPLFEEVLSPLFNQINANKLMEVSAA